MPPKSASGTPRSEKTTKPPVATPSPDVPVADPKRRQVIELQSVYMRVVTSAMLGGFVIGALTIIAEGYIHPTEFSSDTLRRKAFQIGGRWLWLVAFDLGAFIVLVLTLDKWAIPRLAALIEVEPAGGSKKDK